MKGGQKMIGERNIIPGNPGNGMKISLIGKRKVQGEN